MPENERRLKRHKRSWVLRNEAGRVVSSWTIRQNGSSVDEGARLPRHLFTTIHRVRCSGLVILRLRVELDLHRIRIDVLEKHVNLKQITIALLLDSRGAESQR